MGSHINNRVQQKEFTADKSNLSKSPFVAYKPLPWNAFSISTFVGIGLFLRRVYIDITIPGVQNPHWDPWDLAILSFRIKHSQKK